MSEQNSEPWLYDIDSALPEGLHGKIMQQLRTQEKKRRRRRMMKVLPAAAVFVFILAGSLTFAGRNFATYDISDDGYENLNSDYTAAVDQSDGVTEAYENQKSERENAVSPVLYGSAAYNTDNRIFCDSSRVSAEFLAVKECSDAIRGLFIGEYSADFDALLLEDKGDLRIYSYSHQLYEYCVNNCSLVYAEDGGDKIIIIGNVPEQSKSFLNCR